MAEQIRTTHELTIAHPFRRGYSACKTETQYRAKSNKKRSGPKQNMDKSAKPEANLNEKGQKDTRKLRSADASLYPKAG